MHKIFAKPSFLGKNVVYLPECHSTNDELSDLIKSGLAREGTVIYTDFQTKGKGQRGNAWVSEPRKNLLCSIYIRPTMVLLADQFFLNVVTGLAIIDLLDEIIPSHKCLKWPNDVYVEGNKIAGILIECNVKENMLESAILGIGLNVNQSNFSIGSATSILLESNRHHLIDEVLEQLLCSIEKWYEILIGGGKEELISQYYERLMWFNEAHEFRDINGHFFGQIEGIDNHGRLLVRTKESGLRAFAIKELEFIK